MHRSPSTSFGRHHGHRFIARTITVAAVAVAALGLAVGTASAKPSCATLSKAIATMEQAAENARAAGNVGVANYRHETALYYLSLSDQQGCI